MTPSRIRTTVAKTLYYLDVENDLPFGVPPFDDMAERYQARYYEKADYMLMEILSMPESDFRQFVDRFHQMSVGAQA